MPLWLIIVIAVVVVIAAVVIWARTHPEALPYNQRFFLAIPRPRATSAKGMLGVLAPRSGERMLEIGPGTGYYTLDVAEAVAPGGRVDIVDVHQEYLDHVGRRAEGRGIETLKGWRADARDLPFGDKGFDGAFLVTVLGEVPDQDAALRELYRVLRPGGRLVVGEIVGDPHFVTLGALRRRAEGAGLRFESKRGTPLGYLARFTRPS